MGSVIEADGCTPDGVRHENAKFEPFTIHGGGPLEATRKEGHELPVAAPLVVCPLQGDAHGKPSSLTASPTLTVFVQAFSAPPLLTQ